MVLVELICYETTLPFKGLSIPKKYSIMSFLKEEVEVENQEEEYDNESEDESLLSEIYAVLVRPNGTKLWFRAPPLDLELSEKVRLLENHLTACVDNNFVNKKLPENAEATAFMASSQPRGTKICGPVLFVNTTFLTPQFVHKRLTTYQVKVLKALNPTSGETNNTAAETSLYMETLAMYASAHFKFDY